MGVIHVGNPWPPTGGGPSEVPEEAGWLASPPPMEFEVGIADTYPFSQAIAQYSEATLAVFPNRGWFRAAFLAGCNLSGFGIGVTPTANRIQVDATTSTSTGSVKVDFELRPYVPYIASVSGAGQLNPTGRDVDVIYTTPYDDPKTFATRVYEPGGAPYGGWMSWAPGAGGGKDDYGPVAAVLNDMRLIMTVGDYPDTNLGVVAFDPDARAMQYREFMELHAFAVLGYLTDKYAMGGHSGGVNTTGINEGTRHANLTTRLPESLALPATMGNPTFLGSIWCSSQAVDGVSTPYEDSFTTLNPNFPALVLSGDYDIDRKFHTIDSRRRLYDDSTMPAALRFALYGFHPGGTFTGQTAADVKHVQDWIVKDYYLNLIRAWCDWLFYGNHDGLAFILNDAYLPSQIVSLSEDRALA